MPDENRADRLVGTLLDERYRVRRRIAYGGTAGVYLGTDERLERDVALKIIHPHFAHDPRFVQRAQREAKAAARVHHPHVVAVLDQGHTRDGVVYLVLEYVAGPTLRELIARQAPMSPARTLDLLIPVLRGLAQAHRCGLVHRDVKPENVLVSPEGVVKVADFGLTRAVDEHTVTSAVLGTVGYAAPELVGDGPIDQRSDVYSVGIMTYEMLTAARPYTGTALQVANAHVSRDVPAPGRITGGIPPGLDEFVLRATARDAARRPADAVALLDLALAIHRSLPRDPQATEVLAAPGPAAAPGGPAEDGVTEVLAGPGARERSGAAAAARASAPPDETATEAVPAAGPTRAVPAAAPRPVPAPRVLPAHDPDATRTTAIAAAGSTAPHRPDRPRVTLNPQPRPVHIALGVIGFALFLALAAFLGWWLASAPGTGARTVPAVAGSRVADAERSLSTSGIANVGVHTATSRDVPAGHVISSEPGQSAHVRSFEQVTLVVSSGPAQKQVPDVVGMDLERARAALAAAGLGTGEVSAQFSQRPEATVLWQGSEAGTSVAEGSAVDLGIATATPQGDAPNVVGRRLEDARGALEERGFTLRVREPLGSAGLGRVVHQRRDGDVVTLTVL